MANGSSPAGAPTISDTAAMRSGSGAMPIHTAPKPRSTASNRMFSTQALMSCTAISGKRRPSVRMHGTMAQAAPAAGFA